MLFALRSSEAEERVSDANKNSSGGQVNDLSRSNRDGGVSRVILPSFNHIQMCVRATFFLQISFICIALATFARAKLFVYPCTYDFHLGPANREALDRGKVHLQEELSADTGALGITQRY